MRVPKERGFILITVRLGLNLAVRLAGFGFPGFGVF